MLDRGILSDGLEAIFRAPPSNAQLSFYETFDTFEESYAAAIGGAVDTAKAVAFYQVFYNRVPDSKGLTYWTDVIGDGRTDAELGERFFDQGEFVRLYSGLSTAEIVNALYRNVLDREPDAEGFAYWIEQVNNGLSLAQLGRYFATSDETRERFEPLINEFLLDAALGEEKFKGSLFDEVGPPEDLALSSTSIQENGAAGAEVGTLSATHPDDDETITYTLTDDAGGAFAISGDKIVATGPLDFEGTNSYSITVEADSGTGTSSRTFTIGVTNDPADDGPTGPVDPDNAGALSSYDTVDTLGTNGNEVVRGDGGNNAFTGNVGYGDANIVFPGNTNQRTANAGDVLRGGAGTDAFFLTRAENGIDDGQATITGVSGLSVEVVSVSNRDEEDRDGDPLDDLQPERDFGYSAFFWEDNGPDQPVGAFVDPNINTLGRTNKLNAVGVPLETNGNTEELNGIFFNYYADDQTFANRLTGEDRRKLPGVDFTPGCKVAVPELPLTKQIEFNQPDWVELELEQFESLEELYAQDSVNGIIFSDVQQSFWETKATLNIVDVKADMVMLDSDLQAIEQDTPKRLNLNLDEVSLSHFVITENYAFEANRGDQVRVIDITASGRPSVIGNIQNGVTDALFMSGEQRAGLNGLGTGLENTGYSAETRAIFVNADEMSLALPQPGIDGELPDGQHSNIYFPDRVLCLNPDLQDQFDLLLGTNVGLGDRLPGLTNFNASESKGDVLAVFAKPFISNIKFGAGADYAIFDEIGENGSVRNLRGVNLDMGEDVNDGSDPNDADIDTLAVFSDDMATLHTNNSVYNNVEVLTALEAVGYGDDIRAADSPNDLGLFDDPDLSDGNRNGLKENDYEGSLFNTNRFDDRPNSAADNVSPIGSNDPFLIDMSRFDNDGNADLAYLHFAHGVDSDIRAQDFAVDEFTIQFDQKCWEVNPSRLDEGYHSSGANVYDNGGLPGSLQASRLEQRGDYEGWDLEIGSDRVVDERVNLYFNVENLDGRNLRQVWNGINEEDIDGVPNHVQSISDQYVDQNGVPRSNGVDTLHIVAQDGPGPLGADLFVDNMRMRELTTLYLSDDGKNGSIRVETGSRGSTNALTLIDGNSRWDVKDNIAANVCVIGDFLQANDDPNIANKDDEYDQLLARLVECSCFPDDDTEAANPWGVQFYALGNDWLRVSSSGAVIILGQGNDVATGGAGADIMYGDGGNDILLGGGGDDIMFGGSGRDVLQGGDGNDYIVVGGGYASGDGGDDVLVGGAVKDILFGGNGDDFLAGVGGNDSLAGGNGDDILLGGVGDDVVVGEGGRDLVDADIGTDVLVGDSYVPGLCMDRELGPITPNDARTIQEYVTDNCPCIKITVTGHNAAGTGNGNLVGDNDRFTVSWQAAGSLAAGSVTYFSSLGETTADVAAGLEALLDAEFGGDFMVVADGNMVEIKPLGATTVLPQINAGPTGGFDDPNGIDIEGAPDRGRVTINDAPYDVGDVITVNVDLDGNGIINGADTTVSYTVGTFSGGTTVDLPANSPLNWQNGDLNLMDATTQSTETNAQIAGEILTLLQADANLTAAGVATSASGGQISLIGPSTSYNFTVSSSIVNTPVSNFYGFETDELDENDKLTVTFQVNGSTVTVEAGVDETDPARPIYYQVNGAPIVLTGEFYDAEGDKDTADILNAFLTGLTVATGGTAYDDAHVAPTTDWSVVLEVPATTLITGMGAATIFESNSTDQDVTGYDEELVDANRAPGVSNGVAVAPQNVNNEFLTVDYCLDHPTTDVFVARSESVTTASFIDGFDNDFLPNDFSGIIVNMPNDTGFFTAGDAYYTNIVSSWLNDPTLQPFQSTQGDVPEPGAPTGTDMDGVRGVTYVADFHSRDVVLRGDGGVRDFLAFRNADGTFAADGVATNYAEFHQVASTRDDADADAFNAFAANDQLSFVAISNDGAAGGDNFLRVYFNDEDIDDSAPDAVFELVGYNNVLTQFHYQDIDNNGYTEADYIDPIKEVDYLI